MPRQQRGRVALDLEQRVVAMGAGQKVEGVADPVERPPAQFQRGDGVVEARRRRIAGDGGDLGLVLGERPRIGRPEMLGRDPVEGRHPVGGGPSLEERDWCGSAGSGFAGWVIGGSYGGGVINCNKGRAYPEVAGLCWP